MTRSLVRSGYASAFIMFFYFKVCYEHLKSKITYHKDISFHAAVNNVTFEDDA